MFAFHKISDIIILYSCVFEIVRTIWNWRNTYENPRFVHFACSYNGAFRRTRFRRRADAVGAGGGQALRRNRLLFRARDRQDRRQHDP